VEVLVPKQFPVLLLISILLFVRCNGTTGAGQVKITPDGAVEFIPVAEVIRTIKEALQVAQNQINDDSLPALESVTLTLQTTKTDSTEFSTKLVVIGSSDARETSDTQQVVIKLVPPPIVETPVSPDLLRERLVQAIVATARTAKEAKDAAGGRPTPLVLSTISTELGLSIKRTIGGSVGFDVFTLTLGGKLGEVNQGVHKITLSFKTE
jgi:hypothetical protein